MVSVVEKRNEYENKKFKEVGTEVAVKTITLNASGSVVKLSRLRENLLGSAGTGSDGNTDRVFTLTTTNDVDIVEVFLDGLLLVETSQYSIDNTAKTVTILLNVWDTQVVGIFYNV